MADLTREELDRLEELREKATRDRSEDEHDFLRARIEYAKALDHAADNLIAKARRLEALEEAMREVEEMAVKEETDAIWNLKNRAGQIMKERAK